MSHTSVIRLCLQATSCNGNQAALHGVWDLAKHAATSYSIQRSLLRIENLHVFDSKKFQKVIAALEEKKLITKKQVEHLKS